MKGLLRFGTIVGVIVSLVLGVLSIIDRGSSLQSADYLLIILGLSLINGALI
jgi:uncharacterized membrane protein